MTNFTSATKVELQALLLEMTGSKGTTLNRTDLQVAVERAQEQANNREVARLEREEKQRAKDLRNQQAVQRAASRGPVEEFVQRRYSDVDGDEREVLCMAKRMLDNKSVSACVVKDMVERLQNNPLQALTSAQAMFVPVAEGKVAEVLLAKVASGYSSKELLDYATKQALQLASCNANSTSTTSNLMERAMTEAWAKFARDWN